MLTTNRLQVYMLALDNNNAFHVIDYVQFAGPNSSFNVNSNLADGDTGSLAKTGVWDTNYLTGATPLTGPTYGILNQIAISKGAAVPAEDGVWTSDPEAIPEVGTIPEEQAFFSAFFKPGNRSTAPAPGATNLNSTVIAPYAPARYVVQYITWQANDPLVHYLASDISAPDPNMTTVPAPGVSRVNAGASNQIAPLAGLNLGRLNDLFTPWAGNPSLFPSELVDDPNRYNLAERDPLLTLPDDWDFPTNPYSSFNWIGRVHRGTPWQTVYLKADNLLVDANGLNIWQAWTDDGNSFDAMNSAPVQDWHLAGLITSLLNTNPVGQLVSVNNPDTNAWLGVLNGLTAWTNYELNAYDPLLISSSSPQAAIIASAIQATRTSLPGQSFADVGDILATEQLTEQSPFLDTSVATYLDAGVNDEAYEIIPSQLLSLLRADSCGSVAWNNGQMIVSFTGWNIHPYAIQVSSDLVNWVNVSTNYPVNGIFSYTNFVAPGIIPQFYRTLLLR